jgi:hypothetical protein
MSESGCLKDVACQNLQVEGVMKATTAGKGISYLRQVLSKTDSYTLSRLESGAIVTGNKAAGMTITLPTAEVGLTYDIHVGTTITSNAFIINTDGTDTFQGQLITNDFNDLGSITLLNEAVPTVGFDQPSAADNQISMNGTTTGGKLGSYVRCTAISAAIWFVEGFLSSDGVLATCFATV